MKNRPTAEKTLAEYVDRSILDGYSKELHPAILAACKQHGFSCFRAGLDQGIAIGMYHAHPEPEPGERTVSWPVLRIIIRALLTPAALLLFGIAGVARMWIWGGKFSINSPTTSQAVRLLRRLHDLQNGPPLEKYRQEWEEVMSEVQDFLEKHE